MKPAFLLTRPAEDAARLAADLAAVHPGARIVIAPQQRIVFAGALPALQGIGQLAFTSRNGVRAWDTLGGPALPAWCVGEATAQAARAAGMTVRVAGGDVGDLTQLLLDSAPAGGILHVHGAHRQGALVETLTARGAAKGLAARGFAAYDQQAQPLTGEARAVLDGTGPVVVPLFSPRSAALFEAEPRGKAPLFVAAMSPAVVRALGACQMRKCAVALRPDRAAMMDAMGALYRAALRVEGPGAPQ